MIHRFSFRDGSLATCGNMFIPDRSSDLLCDTHSSL